MLNQVLGRTYVCIPVQLSYNHIQLQPPIIPLSDIKSPFWLIEYPLVI